MSLRTADKTMRIKLVGNGTGLMIGVLSLCGILIIARAVTTVYMVEEWYAWWQAPVPTVLPRDLPVPAEGARPIGNPAQWFRYDDYPADARAQQSEGRTAIKLLISVDGRPTACEVAKSSGWASLDQATCRIAVRRGAFVPAHDSAGRNLPSAFTMPGVRWQLEN